MKSIMTVLFFFLSIVSFAQDKIVYLTDTEGDIRNLSTLIDDGSMVEKNGVIDFIDKDTKLVFGGDLPDRGPNSVEIREKLVALKKKYPDRVTLLWGNRDLNKIAVLRDLIGLRDLSIEPYKNILIEEAKSKGITNPTKINKYIKSTNTPEKQLGWALNNLGAGQALDFHQEELSKIKGRQVSRSEAAKDFIASITPPNGEYFKYLELGQLGDVQGNKLFVHGGVTEQNFGVIPGDTKRYENVSEWIKKLNSWGKEELQNVKKSIVSNPQKIFKNRLIIYGDANWDPFAKAVLASEQSVVYPRRFKENGNFRLPDDNTLGKLKKSGINYLVLGHSPAGNLPVPLKGDDFVLLMADTSFGPSGGKSSVVLKGDDVIIKGTTGSGEKVNATISSKSQDPYIGKKVNDEYTVIGKSKNNKYIMYKYFDGFKLDEKVISARELKKQKVEIPIFFENEEEIHARKVFQEGVEKKGLRPLPREEFWRGDFLNGRKPLYFSGASKLSFEDGSEDKVRKFIISALDKANPKEVIIGTGGTHHGVEKIVHEEALKRGFDIIGTPISKAAPGELTDLKYLSIVGDDWGEMLLPALKWVDHHNGEVVFVAGGGIVREGIESAAKMKNLKFHLFDGVGGASQELLPKFPNRNSVVSLKESQLVSEVPTKSVKEVRDFFKSKKKKVVTFVGFSGAEYQDPKFLMKNAESFLRNLDPKKHIINIGATKDGIGKVYELAKKMGFETSGIVSVKAKKYGGLSEFVDHPMYVVDDSWGGYFAGSKKLTPTSKAMVESSDIIIGIGGGAVGADELDAGRRLGKRVVYVATDMNHEIAIAKAKKSGKSMPTDFRGDSEKSFFKNKKSKLRADCNTFELLNSITNRNLFIP